MLYVTFSAPVYALLQSLALPKFVILLFNDS